MKLRSTNQSADFHLKLGLCIREVRRARKLTYREVATMADVAIGSVQNLEHGGTGRVFVVLSICEALNFDFFGFWREHRPVCAFR